MGAAVIPSSSPDRHGWGALLLTSLALLPAAAGPAVDAAYAAEAPRPNVLLVTIDTLRPDSLGWVAGANSTPTIDALATGAVAFPAAVAPAPLTLPAHTSLFSGLVPRRHGVRDNHQVVGVAPPLLAERLSAAGYHTAAFVSGFPLTAQFGLARGFATYDDHLSAGDGAWLERPADQTAAAVRAWLGEAPAPWFLWVHFYDPHFPYVPPPGMARPGRRGDYDGEVAWVDRQLGTILAALPPAAPGSRLTILAGDHGEALGGHGEGTHGFFIYDDTVLVPLLFSWPGRLAPRRSAAAARLVDVAPTVLDLLDLVPLPQSDGVSLAPLLTGASEDLPPAYIETLQPWYSYGWAPLSAVRHGAWKLIAAPTPELYDLARDPEESDNLFGHGHAQELELRRYLRAAESAPPAIGAGVSDPQALERLRALGYLGSTPESAEPPRTGLADPKDRLALRELLTGADEALRQGQLEHGVELLTRALAEEPGNRFAQARLGIALVELDRPQEAERALARALELAPEDPETRAAHAELLMRSGRSAEAVGEWMEVLRLQPERVAAWSNLGAALGLSGQAERAVAAYQRAAELEPETQDRWVRLAFAAFAAGQIPQAIEHLERAAGLGGEQDFTHAGALGLLLLRAGRSGEARTWLGRSRPPEAEFADARLALARLLLTRGDVEGARQALAEGLRLSPDLGQRAAADPDLRPLLEKR
jgi:arylsulfatase A-like enzyme/Flp pilus assembly protein TadD